MISGIINILKPAGITSNAVLTEVKKKLHPKKIGHLGTLDPSGVGVLPVCINKATKLFDYYLKKDKVYRAIFVFGKETDTLDSDGKITSEQKNLDISFEEINSVLYKFIGKINQIPPKYSAKNLGGKKAYELARRGIEFNLKPKEVEIYDIKLIQKLEKNTYLFQIYCSSGTYIRSLARDIAKELNTVAYMGAIIRTKSGNFSIENSIKLDDITEENIICLENILKDWKNIFVNDEFYDKIINGNTIKIKYVDTQDVVVYCKNKLIGIADILNGILKIKTSLWEKND